MKQLLLRLIRFYQHFLSPDTGIPHKAGMTSGWCRFQPTCSEYTYQSISKYGILKGSFFGIKRIFSCHPLKPGGFNPVP